MKNIYVGPFNNDNKQYLKEKALNYLKENKGDKFYYILPNSQLLKNYRREFIREVDSTFDLNLCTFDDIVNDIVKGDFRKTIGDPMKSLVIRKILKDLVSRDQLEYYKDFIDMKGFIESCIDIIREIKRSLLSPEEYLQRCPNNQLYREIGLIYKEYEIELESNKLTDRENDYLNCLKSLDENVSHLRHLDFIIIDEFYDFRPIELEIINKLSNMDMDIHINMPFGAENNNRLLISTIKELETMGFEKFVIEKNKENIFEALSERLFSNSDKKFEYIDGIEIIKGPSRYLELKRIFREMKKYLLEGISLQDMGLVVLSNGYLNSLKRVSLEEEIPLSIGSSSQLIMTPLVKEFCNLINSRISTTKSNILNRIKSTYFPICNENKDEMEYIVRGLDFNDLNELEELLGGNRPLSVSEEFSTDLFQLVNVLKVENTSIPKEGEVDRYNECFIKLIDDYHIDRWIINKFQGDQEIINRDLNALEMLRTLLNKMDEIGLIQQTITIEEYFIVLQDYLSSESIMESDYNLNGLQVLNPINTRGLSFKKLFIVGLSQEEYPNLNNTSFFLKDDNYGVLKGMGISLKDYHERFSNEALKFKTIISSCSEDLFMSYNENSLEEGKNIPSMFIDEILSRIDGDEIEEKLKVINLEVDYLINSKIEDSSCEKDFTNSLLYKYFKGNLDEKFIKIHEDRYPGKLEKINSIAELAYLRSSNDFNNYRGKLDYELIKDIIKKDLEDKVFSISYLEGYSKCPYYFLLSRYFNIEEMGRDVEKYSPLDIGSIYHQVLYQYYRRYQRNMENILEFQFEETLDELKSLVYKHGKMEGFNQEDEKDLLIIENIYIRLMNLISSDIDRLKKSPGIVPYDFEVEFGKNKEFEIEYDNKKIKLRGLIDRIDKLPNDKYMVLDYKSSSYGKQDISRIEEGLSLQLPVYIMSQEERDIVAGSYLTISDGEFFLSMGILGQGDFINKRQKGAIDKDKWDEILYITKMNIVKYVNSIHEGDFSVNPKDCSPYCPYKDICRYEKVLEVE